jgi:hypothetical protein
MRRGRPMVRRRRPMVRRRPPTPKVLRRKPPVPGIPIPRIPLPPIPDIGIKWGDVDRLRPQIDFHTGEERIHIVNLPNFSGGSAQDPPRDGDDPPGGIGDRIEVPITAHHEASLAAIRLQGSLRAIEWFL